MNAIDNASKRATCQTNIFRLNGSLEIQWAIELTSVVSKWKWERERERESDWQSETNIFNPKRTIHLTSKVKLSCSVKLQIHFTDLFQIVFWALAN